MAAWELPRDKWLLAYWIVVLQGLASAVPWNVYITETEFFALRVHQPPFIRVLADNFETLNLLTSMIGNLIGFLLYVPLHHVMSLDVQVLWPQVLTLTIMAASVVLTLKDTVSGNSVIAIILSSQAVLGLTNATITGGIYAMASWLPATYIQGMSLGIGLGGVAVSSISFITLWAVPRGAGPATPAQVAPAAFAYFLGSAAVVLLAIATYYIFFMLPYVHSHSIPEVLAEWEGPNPSSSAPPANLRRESANFLRMKTRSSSTDMLSASLSRSVPDLERSLLASHYEAGSSPSSSVRGHSPHRDPFLDEEPARESAETIFPRNSASLLNAFEESPPPSPQLTSISLPSPILAPGCNPSQGACFPNGADFVHASLPTPTRPQSCGLRPPVLPVVTNGQLWAVAPASSGSRCSAPDTGSGIMPGLNAAHRTGTEPGSSSGTVLGSNAAQRRIPEPPSTSAQAGLLYSAIEQRPTGGITFVSDPAAGAEAVGAAGLRGPLIGDVIPGLSPWELSHRHTARSNGVACADGDLVDGHNSQADGSCGRSSSAGSLAVDGMLPVDDGVWGKSAGAGLDNDMVPIFLLKGEEEEVEVDVEGQELTLGEVVHRLWGYNLVAALGLVVTMATFPGITSAVCSVYNDATTAPCNPNTPYGRFFGDLFVPFMFLACNGSDLCGRLLAGVGPWAKKPPSMTLLVVYSLLRIPLSIPLLFCNIVTPTPWRLPVLFRSDAWPVGTAALLGLTNGHLQSLALMHAPSVLPKSAKDRCGPLINFALALGTMGGSLLSFAFTYFLQRSDRR